MTWTKDPPKVPGWYWYRDASTKDERTHQPRALIFDVRPSSMDESKMILMTHMNIEGDTEMAWKIGEDDDVEWAELAREASEWVAENSESILAPK